MNLPSLPGVTGVQVVPPSVLTSIGEPVSVPRVAVPFFRVRLTSVSAAGLSTATSNTSASPSATFGLLTLFTSALGGGTSVMVPVPVTGVVWSLVAASSVSVSSASVSVSFTAGTRTFTPFSLPAGTVAVNLPSLPGVTGVQVLPPSVLTSTGVPVSVPRVAVPFFRVSSTGVSACGASSATS